MDLPSFLIGVLPFVAVGFVAVVAFRRRHDRHRGSPMMLNPYTLALERDVDAQGHLPVVQPAPPTGTSLPLHELPESLADPVTNGPQR